MKLQKLYSALYPLLASIVFTMLMACGEKQAAPTAPTTIYVSEKFGIKFDGSKIYITREQKPDSLVGEVVMEVRDDTSHKKIVTGSWVANGQVMPWGSVEIAPDTVVAPADSFYASLPQFMPDTMYVSDDGLSPYPDELAGGCDPSFTDQTQAYFTFTFWGLNGHRFSVDGKLFGDVGKVVTILPRSGYYFSWVNPTGLLAQFTVARQK